VLAGGADRGVWLRLQSEAQMLLHDHPVNRERAARGWPPLNSLWFWGGGALPPAGATGPAAARVQSPAVAGWCRLHGVQDCELSSPASLPGWPGADGDWLFEWRVDRGRGLDDNLARLRELLDRLAGAGRRVTVHSGPRRRLSLAAGGWRRWQPPGRRARRNLAAWQALVDDAR
jgi:hypothetical protein